MYSCNRWNESQFFVLLFYCLKFSDKYLLVFKLILIKILQMEMRITNQYFNVFFKRLFNIKSSLNGTMFSFVIVCFTTLFINVSAILFVESDISAFKQIKSNKRLNVNKILSSRKKAPYFVNIYFFQ